MSWKRLEIAATVGCTVFVGAVWSHHRQKSPVIWQPAPAKMEQNLIGHVETHKVITWQDARKLGYVDEVPRKLVSAMQSGRCVAMVGAGLSYPAGLPGFEGFLERIAVSAGAELKM